MGSTLARMIPSFDLGIRRRKTVTMLSCCTDCVAEKQRKARSFSHGVLFRGTKKPISAAISSSGDNQRHHRLPPNLFYGTGIPACVVVIDKENATVRTGIFMSMQQSYIRTATRSSAEQDIHKIVDVSIVR